MGAGDLLLEEGVEGGNAAQADSTQVRRRQGPGGRNQTKKKVLHVPRPQEPATEGRVPGLLPLTQELVPGVRRL